MKNVFRLLPWLLGLGREEDARALQRVWLLAGPPLAAFFALENEDFRLISWLVLGLLAAGFFWDGLQGWGWARRRLWILAGYPPAVFAGLIATSGAYWPELPVLEALFWYAAVPLLWPVSLVGIGRGLFYRNGIPAALAVLGVWLTLFLANLAGNWQRRQGKTVLAGRTGEDLPAPGGEEEIEGSEKN